MTDIIWIVEDGFRIYGLGKIGMDALGWQKGHDNVFDCDYWYTYDNGRAHATCFLMGATFKYWDEESWVKKADDALPKTPAETIRAAYEEFKAIFEQVMREEDDPKRDTKPDSVKKVA